MDLVGKWLRDIHNITVPLSDPSFLQSMQQRGRENCRKREYESRRLRHQANSEELAVLEKLLADREVLDDVQLARLEELRSARERVRERQNESNRLNSAELAALEQLEADEEVLDDVQLARLEELRRAKKRHNEAALSSYHAKRQKREEAAPVESHPMIAKLLLVTSNKNSSKLMRLISNGILKKVLLSYFVLGQKMKLSDKFLETVDGCEEVSRFLVISCLDNHIPELSTMMKDGISCTKPLSMDNSNRAQEIILQLFP